MILDFDVPPQWNCEVILNLVTYQFQLIDFAPLADGAIHFLAVSRESFEFSSTDLPIFYATSCNNLDI